VDSVTIDWTSVQSDVVAGVVLAVLLGVLGWMRRSVRTSPRVPPTRPGATSRPVPGLTPAAQSPSRLLPVLEVVSSDAVQEAIVLEDDTILGRKPGTGVTVTGDRYMSARHVRFRCSGDTVWISDLDSMRGTVVNGGTLTPYQEFALSAGDLIHVGRSVFRLTYRGA
jgi:FHA domain